MLQLTSNTTYVDIRGSKHGKYVIFFSHTSKHNFFYATAQECRGCGVSKPHKQAMSHKPQDTSHRRPL